MVFEHSRIAAWFTLIKHRVLAARLSAVRRVAIGSEAIDDVVASRVGLTE